MFDIVITYSNSESSISRIKKEFPDKNKYELKKLEFFFREANYFKYWFRSIETFLPSFNKIFFITAEEIPEWLNINNEKIKIVKHEDFINKKYLPSFNSQAIELNIPKIKELSEQFIYFNDDMFLLQNSSEEDWFKDGLILDFKEYENLNDIATKKNSFLCGIRGNNMRLILRQKEISSKDFDNNVFINQHLPQPLLKSACDEIFYLYGDKLENTFLSKFRNAEDQYNQYLFRDYLLLNDCFYDKKRSGKKFYINDVDNICDYIEKQKGLSICINDVIIKDENLYNEYQEKIEDSFSKILPNKSSFEKS